MAPFIEAVSLHVSRGERLVLRDVSFVVNRGESYALLGGNGAGKSTTLLTFLGLLSPVSGVARVHGCAVSSNPTEARRSIAYLPESAALYDHLDALENLRYFLQLAGTPAADNAVKTVLDKVGLADEARRRRLAEYSKGMRQKVALALALLRRSDVLLLDEPTSGLDPSAVDDFNDLVRLICSEGRAVLMVTHDLYGACQSADRIGLLRQGELVSEFSAPSGERIDPTALRQAFTKHFTA
jgi:ABC-2 type transport system ATP-binding protein